MENFKKITVNLLAVALITATVKGTWDLINFTKRKAVEGWYALNHKLSQ